MKPTFFATPAAFRAWFKKHHKTAPELLVGFYKKDSGKPSITWPESVDEALCVGWIDGVRKSLGVEAYTIRFTPRRATSIWSAINIARVAELTALGRMQPAGLAAFEKRTAKKSVVYSYEQKDATALDAKYEKTLRANKAAWAFFSSQANWYRRNLIRWVMTAKAEETRLRRLSQLMTASAEERRLR
jgi:uncharacterized protein YdeI (YjbR/CyaY-like superfamily)